MGRAKQMLRYRGSTLTGAVTRTLLRVPNVRGVVVVTRSSLLPALELPDHPKVQIAVNDNSSGEMIDSIRIGLGMLGSEAIDPSGDFTSENDDARPGPRKHPPYLCDGVLVVPGDMPALTLGTYRLCVEAFRAYPQRIVIAAHAGRRGHPIIFPYQMRAVVDRLGHGLNELARRDPGRVHLVEIDDPGVTRDIDTPADYESLSKEEPSEGNKRG